MTVPTYHQIYNKPEFISLLKQLYSYDPHLGVITYIGPPPTQHHTMRQLKHIERDGQQSLIVPLANVALDKFYEPEGRFAFRSIQVRTRHLAWRLALPDDQPMPKRVFRKKDAPGLDLKLSSLTTDSGESTLGKRSRKIERRAPHALPDHFVDVASKDERVRALIESDAEAQMKDYIRRLMLIHPPLQTAWAQAKAIYEGKAMTDVTPQRDGETHGS